MRKNFSNSSGRRATYMEKHVCTKGQKAKAGIGNGNITVCQRLR